MRLTESFDSLSNRQVILFGGKGGVGKTTISSLAALHFAQTRQVILFTTDPASNLADLFPDNRQPTTDNRPPDNRPTDNRQPSHRQPSHRQPTPVPPTTDNRPTDNPRVEALEASALYTRFLGENLEEFLEIGDRGTYLDREELRRFFELSLPGVDEIMAWMRIGELAEEHPDALVVVDTAPTGHALRMLGAAEHFRQFASALEAMQEKHRAMVRQLTRRDVRDAVDGFIEDFEATARRRRELLEDRGRAAFVPVLLSEPWVVEQTLRLTAEVREDGIDVPFAVLNRAVVVVDCARCETRRTADDAARARLAPLDVVAAPRSCSPIDTVDALRQYLSAGSGVAC